jgi:ER lumen protein retaining receptor
MNLFRIIADLSHTSSKCILVWAIHSNKSAEGKTPLHPLDILPTSEA